MSNKTSPEGRGSEHRRDREATKERLLEAAVEVLSTKGFDSLGVNAVAERAGVSKVLIYRYFGSLEGLLEEVGRRLDPASIGAMEKLVERRLREGASVPEVLEESLFELQARLEKDPLTQALLVWELSTENELTRSFARVREEAGERLNRVIRRHLPKESDIDLEAVIAILSGGMYYLGLRRRFVSSYNEVPLNKDEGWKRLARAGRTMLEGLLRDPE
jgi:AcrR family transcriptional regulator